VTGLLCKLYSLSSVLLIVMLVSVSDRWPLRLIVSYPALFLSFLPSFLPDISVLLRKSVM